MFSFRSSISAALAKSLPDNLGAISWNISKSNIMPEPMRAEENPSAVCALRKRWLLISSLVAFNTAMLVFRFSVMRWAWMASQPE